MGDMLDGEDEWDVLATPLRSDEKSERINSNCSAKNARMKKFFLDFPRMKSHPIVQEFVEDINMMDIYDIQLLSILVVHTPFAHEMKTDPILQKSKVARQQRRQHHLQEIKRRVNEIQAEAKPVAKPSLLKALMRTLLRRNKDNVELK